MARRVRHRLTPPPRPQTCKDCWTRDGIDFHVPNGIWRLVTEGRRWSEGITNPKLCLQCFDRRAERAGVDYSGAITVLGRRSWLSGAVLPSSMPAASSSGVGEQQALSAGACPRALALDPTVLDLLGRRDVTLVGDPPTDAGPGCAWAARPAAWQTRSLPQKRGEVCIVGLVVPLRVRQGFETLRPGDSLAGEQLSLIDGRGREQR